MAKQNRYDDEFRAAAVFELELQGWPDKKGALQAVATHHGIPATTLLRWAKGKQNPPPDQLVNKKRLNLKKEIKNELAAIFPEMEKARQDASYRDLGTIAAILIDKLQLLENKPTERVAHDVQLTDEDRANRITALLDRARTRATGQSVSTDD
jgi:transposase-like protein